MLAMLLATALAAPPPAPSDVKVKLGIDVLLDGDAALLAGKRVGLITNPSGVDGNLVPTADRLFRDERIRLVRLFGPEHGIRGDAWAGDSVKDDRDPVTGLPVESLYGDRKRPSDAALADVDVMVFDIQDVGSRTYTYVSTLGEAMIACAGARKPLVVLDRPNPLGGLSFEGPVMREAWKSFIGWSAIPVTHGMTAGEIARFYAGEVPIACDLHVVMMDGWTRAMTFDDTGLTWVQTSPHIPHALSATVYVATGMLGGCVDNVNEGVGYTMPFETLAAEFIDPQTFAAALSDAGLPGVRFVPVAYRPFYGKFKDRPLRGARLVVDDPHAFRPVRTALAAMTTLQRLYPKDWKPQEGRTFNTHWGDPDLLDLVRAGKSVEQIEAHYASELAEFGKRREKYLLYR